MTHRNPAGSARDAVCNTDQFNDNLTLLRPSRDMSSSRQVESHHSPAESILDDLNDLILKEYACEKQRETQAPEARANRLDPARKSHRWYCQRQTASRASCKVVSKFGILFGKPDGHDYWSWSRYINLNTIAGLNGRLVLAGGLCTAKKTIEATPSTHTTNCWEFNYGQSNFVTAESCPRGSTVFRVL
jgi:hypothetical protein